jgi:hypothetical protein
MLLEEAIEGQALLAEPRDEAAQGGKAIERQGEACLALALLRVLSGDFPVVKGDP